MMSQGDVSPLLTCSVYNKNIKLLNESKATPALNNCVPVICFFNHIVQKQQIRTQACQACGTR